MSFYTRPELLNRELMRGKRIAPINDFGFAAKLNSLFLAGVEFADACKEYPIVFTSVGSEGQSKVVPVVVLGLREAENLFVSATQQWDGRYVPAFVRRYPFVLAELPGQQMGVCIDTAYPGFSDSQGEALFDAQGSNTPFLQNALDFLNRYQIEHMRTERFCKRLVEHGLLVEMNAKAELKNGSSYLVNGLMVIDEKKLLALPDATALEVFRSGELSWVYAHLLSLPNLNNLIDKLDKRSSAEPVGTVEAPKTPA
jgi:hypothetical protein